MDARLRLIFDNGTKSNMLMRSLHFSGDVVRQASSNAVCVAPNAALLANYMALPYRRRGDRLRRERLGGVRPASAARAGPRAGSKGLHGQMLVATPAGRHRKKFGIANGPLDGFSLVLADQRSQCGRLDDVGRPMRRASGPPSERLTTRSGSAASDSTLIACGLF